MTVAFVLGGGGVRGAVHVGMLKALFEAEVRPDLLVGTSIGAINGAAVAADPISAVVGRLLEAWASPTAASVYADPWYRQVAHLALPDAPVRPGEAASPRHRDGGGGPHVRGPPGAARGRGGEHRAGRAALVRQRTAR